MDKLIVTLMTVEDGGLLANDLVYPEKQYAFESPDSFYVWLCERMGTSADAASLTYDGRAVLSGHTLDRLHLCEEWLKKVYRAWLDSECQDPPFDEVMFELEKEGIL